MAQICLALSERAGRGMVGENGTAGGLVALIL